MILLSTARLGSLLLAAALLAAGLSCFSSRNRPIAFVSTADGDSEVMLLDAETGEAISLTDNQGRDFDPRWSPDGEFLAYVTDESGDLEINLVGRDGESTIRLTNSAGDDLSPRWSPDGKRLAFISHRNGQPEVYLMNADGTNPTRITSNSYEDRMGDWSPDQEWLVFYTVGREEGWGLWLRNPDGVNLVHLTSGQEKDPVWSPDGKHIAFVRIEDENSDVYVVTRSGDGNWQDDTVLTRLTRHEAPDLAPAWSPDSKSIAFVSFRDGSAEIYTVPLDGLKPLRLTINVADDLDPQWSPDGKRIAFVSHVYGASEIVVMDANGENQRRLTNNDSEDRSPRW